LSTNEPHVVIVGAGVAGSEAAWRCARAGLRTLLVTTSLDTSYNLARDRERLQPPAGSLLAELVSAVGGPDGQVQNFALHRAAKRALESEQLLHTLQSTVSGLVVEGSRVVGVNTWEGVERRAGVTALCVGSFLRARLTIGSVVEQQGRLSEMAYDDLYLDLVERGFEFEEAGFAVPAVHGALPYTVSSAVFRAEEFPAPALVSRRLAGLFAAGACVRPASAEPPGYEQAARQGLVLAEALQAVATG